MFSALGYKRANRLACIVTIFAKQPGKHAIYSRVTDDSSVVFERFYTFPLIYTLSHLFSRTKNEGNLARTRTFDLTAPVFPIILCKNKHTNLACDNAVRRLRLKVKIQFCTLLRFTVLLCIREVRGKAI